MEENKNNLEKIKKPLFVYQYFKTIGSDKVEAIYKINTDTGEKEVIQETPEFKKKMEDAEKEINSKKNDII